MAYSQLQKVNAFLPSHGLALDFDRNIPQSPVVFNSLCFDFTTHLCNFEGFCYRKELAEIKEGVTDERKSVGWFVATRLR